MRDQRHSYLIYVSLLFGRRKAIQNIRLRKRFTFSSTHYNQNFVKTKQTIKVEYLHKWSCKSQSFIRYSLHAF